MVELVAGNENTEASIALTKLRARTGKELSVAPFVASTDWPWIDDACSESKTTMFCSRHFGRVEAYGKRESAGFLDSETRR